jgi:serine/threonine protein kinase/Tfp pilus assembly protein PilF
MTEGSSMTADRYQRVKDIFNQVLDTLPDERESVLSGRCSGDGELESEVRRLLAQLEIEAGGVLDSPIIDGAELDSLLDRYELSFEPGEVIAGRFRIERAVGRGGMGQVWEAFDQQLREYVALKTIRTQIASDPKALGRFKQEVLNARRVSHPNVCRVYDFFIHTGPDGQTPFLTMQMLRGETLAELLKRQGKLPEPQARRILGQCAAALKAAHQAGLIHRDFKPGNVMLVPDGNGGLTGIVTDFGLAHYAPGPDEISRTFTAGTPAYMAPEQLAGGELTPATDAYAFAVVACEVLTGKRPGEGGLELLPRSWKTPIRQALEINPLNRGVALPDRPAKLNSRLVLAFAALLVVLGAALLWSRAGTHPGQQAIAVLPFTQESGRVEDRYLGESLSDEIISSLSRVPALSVIARDSSSQLTAQNPDLPAIARRLHTHYVVTGSVRPIDNRIQITAQLIDASTRAILWLETYIRDRSQTATLHAEIARGITSKLGVQVSAAQMSLFGSRLPLQEAGDLYVRGRALWSNRSPANLQNALDAFTKAIQIDPNFALAYAARADTLAIMAERSYLSGAEAFPKAKEAALQAVILDPQLPEAQAALGLVQSIGEWDYYNAEKSLRRAIEAGPSYVYAQQWYAAVLLKTGRHEEAIREAERATMLDPLSPAPLANVGWMNVYSQRYDRAIEIAGRLTKEHPQFANTCLLLARGFLGKREFGEASKALAGCSAELQQKPSYLRSLAISHALAGRKPEAVAILNRMLTPDTEQPMADSHIAAVYASLEQPNEAFYWLDQGVTRRDPNAAMVDVDSFFASIRSDPRYPNFLARIGVSYKK